MNKSAVKAHAHFLSHKYVFLSHNFDFLSHTCNFNLFSLPQRLQSSEKESGWFKEPGLVTFLMNT